LFCKAAMPLLLGILMGIAGFAMLVLGQLTLPGGRVVKGSRRAAGVWLSFLPLAFFASFLMEILDPGRNVDRRLVYWILVMMCLFVGLGFALPTRSGLRMRQGRTASKKVGPGNPFESQPAAPAPVEPPVTAPPGPEPAPLPAIGKPPRRIPAPEKNPFDFS
jgi:hypothetical protein